MAGWLSTHVLDTARGCPAANLALELYRLDGDADSRRSLVATTTNADGRTDAPLLTGDAFQVGCYELVFDVGAYFANTDVDLPDPAFLDRVPLRFGISDPEAHYHVPLLVSPWAYSTYRGS